MPTLSNRRKPKAQANPPGTLPGGNPAPNERGYCYLALFEAYNAVSEKKLDIASLKARYRAFPSVKRIVAELYAHVSFDMFLPCVRRVSNTMFHVDLFKPPMRFSEVVSMTMFSCARIGADDRVYLRQQQLNKVQDLCKTAGLDRNTVLADAAKKVIARVMAAPDSELSAVFEPIMPRAKSGFQCPYDLDVQQLATLQADYPELGVTGGGSIHHPHAYAAVATLCQEAVMLRRIGYDPEAPVPRGYDAAVVDVGANYPRHAKAGRFTVHGCCPILSARDSGRDTTRALVMVALVANSKLSAETARKYTEPDSFPGKKLLRCSQRAEHCAIKAPYMMFVHSQYDVSLEQLGAMFDAHGTIKAYSVMNFVPDIFISSQGTVESLGLTYHKEGSDVVFSFVGDASMNYRHDLQTLLRTYSAQHLITPSGVMYVCERVVRGGALFLEYTRCTIAPEKQAEYFDFNFWNAAASNFVFISTWTFDHSRYAGSKFKKGPAGFKRLIICVDKMFYDRLYTHCIRSGDASFNVNQVVSAASTFNTKMSINGANIRAVNRVGVDVFFDAVVAIYMIAYRARWMSTKTLHHMIESEKDVRNAHKFGFTSAFRALWNLVASKTTETSLFSSVVELWNSFITKCAELNSLGDMDVELLHAVRTVEFSEFLQFNAKYEGKYPELHDIHVESITLGVKDGLLQEVINTVRSKYADVATAPAATPQSDGPSGPQDSAKLSVQPKTTNPDNAAQRPGAAPRIVGAPTAHMSNKLRNSVITEFHRTQSVKTDSNSARLRNGRHEAYACTSVLVQKATPPDGNCVFTSLGYFVGLTANEMRADLCGAVGNTALRYNDKTSATWGTTDCVTAYSSLYQKRVCMHMTVTKNGKQAPTVTSEMYSASETGELVHLDWRAVGNLDTGEHTSGHVEVLTSLTDSRDFPRAAPAWETVAAKFDTVGRMKHADTDEYAGFAKHQELKFLSLMQIAGFATSRPTNILELGAAPGTWTRLLLKYVKSTRSRLTAVSDPNGLAFDSALRAELSGCDAVTLHERDAVAFLKGDEVKYDFAISDVAGPDSWSDNSPQLELLCAVMSRLTMGATLVLKLSNVFLESCVDAIAGCRRLFAKVQLVKPQGSRLRNTEVYLVCEEYGGYIQQLNPYLQRRTIIDTILTHVDSLSKGQRIKREVADEHAKLNRDFLETTQDQSLEWEDAIVPKSPDGTAAARLSKSQLRHIYKLTHLSTDSAVSLDPDTSSPDRIATPTPSVSLTLDPSDDEDASASSAEHSSECDTSDGYVESGSDAEQEGTLPDKTEPRAQSAAQQPDTKSEEPVALQPEAKLAQPLRTFSTLVVTPSAHPQKTAQTPVAPSVRPQNNSAQTPASSAPSTEGSMTAAVGARAVESSPAHSSVFLAENGLVMVLDEAIFDPQHPWQCVAHHISTHHAGKGLYERIMELGVFTERVHYEVDELISLFGPVECDYPLAAPLDAFVECEAAVRLTKQHAVSQLVPGKTTVVRVSDPAVKALAVPGWSHQIYRCRATPPSDMSVYYVYTQSSAPLFPGSWKHTIAQVVNAAVKEVVPYDPALLSAVLHTTRAGGALAMLEETTRCDIHPALDNTCLCCVYVDTGKTSPPLFAAWFRRKCAIAASKLKDVCLLSGGAEALELSKGVPVYMRDDRNRAKGSGLTVAGSTVSCASYVPNVVGKKLPFTLCGQTQRAAAPGSHRIDVGTDQVAHVTTYGSVSKQDITFWSSNARTKAPVVDARGRHSTIDGVSGVVSNVRSEVKYVDRPPLGQRSVRDVATNATDAKFGCVTVIAARPVYVGIPAFRKLATCTTATTQTDEQYFPYELCTKSPPTTLEFADRPDPSTTTDSLTTAASRPKDYATSTTSTPSLLSKLSNSGPAAFTADWKARFELAAASRGIQLRPTVASVHSETFEPLATSSTKSAPKDASVMTQPDDTSRTDPSETTCIPKHNSASVLSSLRSDTTEPTSTASSSAGSSTTTASAGHVSTDALLPDLKASKREDCATKRDCASIASATRSDPAKPALPAPPSVVASSSSNSTGHASDDALLPGKRSSKLSACKTLLKAAIRTTKAPIPVKPAADVFASLPRGSPDVLAVGGIWTAQPNDCQIVVHVIESRGKAYAVTDALAKALTKEKPALTDFQRAGFSRLEHAIELYHRQTGFHEFLLVSAKVGVEALLKKFLQWLPEDVSRVSVESALDLADSALVDVVRECARPVTLVDGRTRKWVGVLHVLNPTKHLLPKPARPVAFPKLSQKEMGYIGNPPLLNAKTNLDKYRNAMIEFRYLTAHADNFNKAHFKRLQIDAKNGIPAGKTAEILAAGYGVYDQTAKTFLGPPALRKYSHGYSVSQQKYVPWNDAARQFTSEDRYILVGRNTELMLNEQIMEQISKVDVMKQMLPEIVWINGPPGCGKTYEIVHSANISTDPAVGHDIILCMTKEGKASIQAGLKKLYPDLSDRALRTHVRTVASLLVNGSSVTYDHVWMDEALMAHAGTIGFVVALTGTKKVSIIGDINQIPYVDREHMCEVKYETPATFADITAVRKITRRCPLDATLSIAELYPGLCSTSTVTISVSQASYSANVTTIPKCTDDCLYLVHTQADKDALIRAGYGKGKGATVLTVHEAQGQTFRHVVCVRSQSKALAIYSSTEYAIVAISRHTHSFRYYTDVDDALTKRIRKAQSMDPAALVAWNAPRLEAAQKELTALAAGGVLSEGDVVMSAITTETTGHYTAGLPETFHSPLMPLAPHRVTDSSYRKLPKVRANVDNDVAFLQAFYDDIMGEAATVEYKYDQMMMELEDTYVASTPISVDPQLGLPAERKYGKLRPLLRTNMRAEKQPSQKESILGAVKRNLNAPVLRNAMLSEEAIGELLFTNFERSAIDPTKLDVYEMYADDTIGINSQVVSAWLEKQPPARRKQIIVDLPLHLRPFNKFEFMVKKDVKPQLTPDSMYTYPSVQTIVYNDASVNAISCPIYNLLWERLLAVLDPRILIMTGMSPKEFENEFNARLSPEVACVLRTIENDFSKYDKAQAGALRRLEHKVWLKLGLDPDIAEIWDRSRRHSDVRDRKNGVAFTTEYQRKSGEATTFSGNTLVAVCVMLAIIDIDDIALMLAAGDDTAVYLKPGVEFSDSSALVADLFNLECKLLECYEIPYFCSKFLISTPDWTYFVHDLLKFVTKLGRHDMSNYTHVENYRISCVDTMSSLFNPVVAAGLTAGLRERYYCTLTDITKVLAVLRTLCYSPEKFAALFLLDKGVTLCNDPSASKLR